MRRELIGGLLIPAFLSLALVASAAEPAPAGTAKALDSDAATRKATLEAKVDDLSQQVADLRDQMKDESPNGIRMFWDNGLNLKGPNFVGRIGGRVHLDVFSDVNTSDAVKDKIGADGFESTVQFRRIWLMTSGEFTGSTKAYYKVELDVSGMEEDKLSTFDTDAGKNVVTKEKTGKLSIILRDVYMGLREVPVVGNVQVGHFSEPFCLDVQTSTNYNTFTERPLMEGMTPSRNVGAMVYDNYAESLGTWALGVFRDTADNGFDQGGGINFTGRVTAAPIYADDGAKVLHLGVADSFRNPNDETVVIRQRPETFAAPYFLDTKSFSAQNLDLLGGELAGVCGPFSLQSEAMAAMVNSDASGNPTFTSWYVFGSYFLTGEHRAYNRAVGAFGRVIPKRNLGKNGGFGAIELATRYSAIDLNDGAVAGGVMHDVTGGVNWYLNPNMRVMCDYVVADLQDVGGAQLCTMRFQVDF